MISDFKNTGAYAKEFAAAGMKIERFGPYLLSTFPPLRIVKATKRS